MCNLESSRLVKDREDGHLDGHLDGHSKNEMYLMDGHLDGQNRDKICSQKYPN